VHDFAAAGGVSNVDGVLEMRMSRLSWNFATAVPV
jgi:hypothetical protein